MKIGLCGEGVGGEEVGGGGGSPPVSGFRVSQNVAG